MMIFLIEVIKQEAFNLLPPIPSIRRYIRKSVSVFTYFIREHNNFQYESLHYLRNKNPAVNPTARLIIADLVQFSLLR